MMMHDYRNLNEYVKWVDADDAVSEATNSLVRDHIEQLADPPKFSIVVLPCDGNSDWGIGMVRSLTAQCYPHWEAWVPRSFLREEGGDRRLNAISDASDAAACFLSSLSAASGEFILPIPADAILSERALYHLAIAAKDNPEATIFFTDEDQLDAEGRRCRPRLKSGWDPDLMLGRDAIGLLVAYERKLLLKISANSITKSDNLSYQISLCATSAVLLTHIKHVPKILCHRRLDPDKPPVWKPQFARDVVHQHLRSIGDASRVLPAPLAPYWNRVLRPLPSPPPLVSVIMLTRDRADLLERSTRGVLERTDYPHLELLIVDNGSCELDAISILQQLRGDSRVRILSDSRPFNYAELNNRAVQEARGEVLVLLNNDTDVINPDWLREMVSHACREDVGAVGAKLLYEDGSVQHAGVVFSQDADVIHMFRKSSSTDPGPDGELALTRSVSAVTGACICLRKSVFLEIGQLEEKNLAVSHNDIDLCLRAVDHGYRIIFTPFAELIHCESATRRSNGVSARELQSEAKEQRWFQSEWRSSIKNELFHNPNVDFRWTSTRMMRPVVQNQSRNSESARVGEARTMTETQRLARTIQRLAETRRDAHETAEQLLKKGEELLTAREELLKIRGELLNGREVLLQTQQTLGRAQDAANEARSQRDAILSSTSWRLAKALQPMGKLLPCSIRLAVRAMISGVARVRSRI